MNHVDLQRNKELLQVEKIQQILDPLYIGRAQPENRHKNGWLAELMSRKISSILSVSVNLS